MKQDNKSSINHQKDLEWLFWQSESAMGIKSNFDSFIRACKYSTNHQDEVDSKAFAEMLQSSTETINIMEATKRERKIMKAYHSLSVQNQQVLEAYYESRQYATALKDFGPGAGLIPFTTTGRELTRLMIVDPKKFEANKLKDLSVKLRREVDALYQHALSCYVTLATRGN
jgi:hypothetical protein